MHKFISKIFPEYGIIIESLQGDISWLDVIEMKKHEVEKPGYSPNFNLITDIRNIGNQINDLNGVHQYLDYFRKNSHAAGDRKTAILTDNSIQVIHSELLRIETSGFPMQLKTVSTYDAAFEWIKLNSEYWPEVINYLESLRRSLCTTAGNA